MKNNSKVKELINLSDCMRPMKKDDLLPTIQSILNHPGIREHIEKVNIALDLGKTEIDFDAGGIINTDRLSIGVSKVPKS